MTAPWLRQNIRKQQSCSFLNVHASNSLKKSTFIASVSLNKHGFQYHKMFLSHMKAFQYSCNPNKNIKHFLSVYFQTKGHLQVKVPLSSYFKGLTFLPAIVIKKSLVYSLIQRINLINISCCKIL